MSPPKTGRTTLDVRIALTYDGRSVTAADLQVLSAAGW